VRVLFVGPFPPTPDGIGRYSYTLVTALERGGHQVAVVVPHEWQGYPPQVIGVLGHRKADQARLLDTVTRWNPDLIHVQFAVAAFGLKTRSLVRWLRLIRTAG
jgi:glycosyltransferase involved in cell wall biosynthesis